jgi:hypothetical protein
MLASILSLILLVLKLLDSKLNFLEDIASKIAGLVSKIPTIWIYGFFIVVGINLIVLSVKFYKNSYYRFVSSLPYFLLTAYFIFLFVWGISKNLLYPLSLIIILSILFVWIFIEVFRSVKKD